MARYALVNPNWDFAGSTYFGCRDPHTPLELLFAAQKIQAKGNHALLIDAQTDDLTLAETRERVSCFRSGFPGDPLGTLLPVLALPAAGAAGSARVVCRNRRTGDKGSDRPAWLGHAARRPAQERRRLVIKGESEDALAALASEPWELIDGVCFRDRAGREHYSSGLAVVDMTTLGALDFAGYNVEKHWHRHHVFNQGSGRGAEIEFARGCPWNCTFCNKQLFRNKFREREVDAVLLEIDRLIARGVDYIYFIDEIFGVGKNVLRLLEEIAQRQVRIGFQTRIDLWDEEKLDLLGRAHTISIECGIESITDAGRDELNKNCRMSTARISELLIYARQRIPWVQANLILTEHDDRDEIRRWQEQMKAEGVWVSEPVPMYPFPGSPLYLQTFGAPPDDQAWERAHHYYTTTLRSQGLQRHSGATARGAGRP